MFLMWASEDAEMGVKRDIKDLNEWKKKKKKKRVKENSSKEYKKELIDRLVDGVMEKKK